MINKRLQIKSKLLDHQIYPFDERGSKLKKRINLNHYGKSCTRKIAHGD